LLPRSIDIDRRPDPDRGWSKRDLRPLNAVRQRLRSRLALEHRDSATSCSGTHVCAFPRSMLANVAALPSWLGRPRLHRSVGNHPVPAGQRLLKFNTGPQEQGTCNFSDASATVVTDRELVHIALERVRQSLAALPRHLLVTQRLTHKCISGEPTCAARPWAGGPATARQICNVEFTRRTNTFDIR
jgi:hypothetical protein